VQVVQRREGAPGAAGSIYNRALYQPEAAPAPRGTPAPPPAAQRPAGQQPPAPAQPAPQQQPGQKKPEEQRNDRFSLIELE
jgi:hypothetical protein